MENFPEELKSKIDFFAESRGIPWILARISNHCCGWDSRLRRAGCACLPAGRVNTQDDTEKIE